jgi:hypothetical protein
MPPAEESRKFDVHACEAGMNIKFPGFSADNFTRPKNRNFVLRRFSGTIGG